MRRHLIVSHGIDGPKMEHFVKLTPDEALRTIHSYERCNTFFLLLMLNAKSCEF